MAKKHRNYKGNNTPRAGRVIPDGGSAPFVILDAWYDTLAGKKGVGIQIYSHVEGEECYADGGCSLFYSLEELEELGIDPDDLVKNFRNYEVICFGKGWSKGEYLIKKKVKPMRIDVGTVEREVQKLVDAFNSLGLTEEEVDRILDGRDFTVEGKVIEHYYWEVSGRHNALVLFAYGEPMIGLYKNAKWEWVEL